MTRRTDAEYANLREATWQHRIRGLTGDEIASALNVPRGTVYRWLREMTEEASARISELADKGLQVELARLDRYLTILEQRIEEVDNPEALLPTAIRVAERRSKLLGLDAATKVDMAVTELTQDDIAFAEVLREAKAKQAAEEALVLGEAEL